MAQTKHLIQYELGNGTSIYIEAEEQGVKGKQLIRKGGIKKISSKPKVVSTMLWLILNPQRSQSCKLSAI
jgi:hypothetical protein